MHFVSLTFYLLLSCRHGCLCSLLANNEYFQSLTILHIPVFINQQFKLTVYHISRCQFCLTKINHQDQLRFQTVVFNFFKQVAKIPQLYKRSIFRMMLTYASLKPWILAEKIRKFMAELIDRARVPIHMPKGMFGLISGFPFILPKKTTITRAQQAVKIPIAIASVQVTRISMRAVSLTETFRAAQSCFLLLL